MNLLTGVIAFCCGSWMFIYLYGLKADHSVKYNSFFNIFPIILFSIVIYCIAKGIQNYEKKQDAEEKNTK